MILFTATSGTVYISFGCAGWGSNLRLSKSAKALDVVMPNAHGIDPRDVYSVGGLWVVS